jgi:hypothetical protein
MQVDKYNFEGISLEKLTLVVRSGDLSQLDQCYREYYNLMDLVRGLHACGSYKGKVTGRAAIVKMLKGQYNLSDYMARRVYADALNFFYSHNGIKQEAWRNIYADKLDQLAEAAKAVGNIDEARLLYKDAAMMRGCFEKQEAVLPVELFRKPNTIYTTDLSDLGGVPEDRQKVAALIDALPDIPVMTKQRLLEDAGVRSMNLFKRLSNRPETVEEWLGDE